MTRIVAGAAKGRRLSVPRRGTRPTSDRAREGLFNTLRGHLDLADARVLDLFAGTGAVGLEALSRGAAAVSFVESDRAAAEVLRHNIETVGLPGARLYRQPVDAYVIAAPGEPFELVFADPPYAYRDDQLAVLLATLAQPGWLAPDAVAVIERAARGAEPKWPKCIAQLGHKRYGEGVLWYGRAHATKPNEACDAEEVR